MAQDKDKLDKLLGFIASLINEPGNEDFTRKLRALVSSNDEANAIHVHKDDVVNNRIDSIYEYCIETVIHNQAVKFYNDFPIFSLQQTLIEDFVRMEYFRRKDNFEDFSLAMYQQIECITSYICQLPEFVVVVTGMMEYSAYTPNGIFEERKQPDKNGKLYKIGDLLFGKEDSQKRYIPINDPKHYATDKFLTVMYFIGYQAKMKSSDYCEFAFYKDMLIKLYQYRNKNHRGANLTDFSRKVYSEVDPYKSEFYLRFLGLLAFFVASVRDGFPNLKNMVESLSNNRIECLSSDDEENHALGPKFVGKIDLSKIPQK